jgi:hypothetical protein
LLSSSAANPEKDYLPLPFHHKEITKIAGELYDQLLKVAVNDMIYSPTATQIKDLQGTYVSS